MMMIACGCLEPLNSLNLNQDDQVREELTKTVIHDNHFIHVLIRLSPPSRAVPGPSFGMTYSLHQCSTTTSGVDAFVSMMIDGFYSQNGRGPKPDDLLMSILEKKHLYNCPYCREKK
jgi:hypothetical protein